MKSADVGGHENPDLRVMWNADQNPERNHEIFHERTTRSLQQSSKSQNRFRLDLLAEVDGVVRPVRCQMKGMPWRWWRRVQACSVVKEPSKQRRSQFHVRDVDNVK